MSLHNRITALLSAEKLNTDQSRELQKSLAEAGYTANSSRYPVPDGQIYGMTSKDIVDFLSDNPEVAVSLSTSMKQNLEKYGFEKELKAIAPPPLSEAFKAAEEKFNYKDLAPPNDPDIEAILVLDGPSLYAKALGFVADALKRGDGGERNWNDKKDPQVWNLQTLLNRAGIETGIDGDYGRGTARSVSAFQEAHGLPVTGQADIQTLNVLTALPETQFSATPAENSRAYTVLEQRKIITDILPKVEAATDVSAEYIKALWGKETLYGTDMNSGTGSRGPFQFTGGTFTDMIQKHGHKIANNLRGIGQDDLAERVENAQNISMDKNLRYDPYVSAYAAAYLTKFNCQNKDEKKVIDTMDENNWGRAYAAYNIGGGGFKVLKENLQTPNVANVIDTSFTKYTPAANNPSFFENGATGQQVLDRYQIEIKKYCGAEFDTRVGVDLEHLKQVQVAEAEKNAAPVFGPQLPTVL